MTVSVTAWARKSFYVQFILIGISLHARKITLSMFCHIVRVFIPFLIFHNSMYDWCHLAMCILPNYVYLSRKKVIGLKYIWYRRFVVCSLLFIYFIYMKTSLLPATAFKLYLNSAFLANEQWGFFSVPHLLWHGTVHLFIMVISGIYRWSFVIDWRLCW